MIELPVRGIGDAAYSGLQLSGVHSASAVAVFERCFYLSVPGAVVCVAAPVLGLGPLTLQLNDNDFKIASDLARRKSCFALEAATTTNAEICSLIWRDATIWPSHLPAADTGSTARFRHDWLKRLAALAPRSSLIATLPEVAGKNACPASAIDDTRNLDHAIQRYLTHSYQLARVELDRLLAAESAVPLTGLRSLAGAGPGLTPSGDDVLAGVLLALHVLGQARARDHLWKKLRPDLRERTHAISSSLLSMAAQGKADVAMHSIMQAWGGNNTADPSRSATLLDTMGQSSGWDTLAGIYMVSAVLDAGKKTVTTDKSQELINA